MDEFTVETLLGCLSGDYANLLSEPLRGNVRSYSFRNRFVVQLSGCSSRWHGPRPWRGLTCLCAVGDGFVYFVCVIYVDFLVSVGVIMFTLGDE